MNAQLVNSAIAQPQMVSTLLATLILIAAITILRSKKNAPQSTIPLQFICLTALFMQLAALAFNIQLISFKTKNCIDIIAIGWWLAANVKLMEFGMQASLRPGIKLGLLLIWMTTLAWQLGFTPPPQWLQQYAAMYRLIAGPILCLGLLSLFSFRLPSQDYLTNIRFFLWGTLLYLVANLLLLFQVIDNSALEAYIYSGSTLASVLLFLTGAIKHEPQHAFSPSRKMAFYAVIFSSTVVFLLIMAGLGSYARQNSGNLSTIVQFVVIIIAFIGMSYVSSSSNLRDRIRVYIDKNFFRHKYDYRNVWLNLIQTLSNVSEEEDFFDQGLQAVGSIFNADGGALWLENNRSGFDLAVTWNLPGIIRHNIPADDNFIKPFLKEEWIYALSESGQEEHDRYLKRLPEWIISIEKVWIVAPLVIGRKLVGFFLLTREQGNERLIWEDIDVIKSTGRQLASYIIRQKSAEELAQSKQFDTYNKLTAFIMHDLKNLIAQQALVVENAQKHKENPAFVEDAIRTIDNSVERMNHLLKRLQRNTHQTAHRSISVKNIITEAIRKSADRQPIPTLRSNSGDAYVIADHDQIVMILMHLVRNAQDATKNDGFIDINVTLFESKINIDIEDNGSGMDEEFINNRLFKPFDSTKSSMGMGIGAYQVREFIEAMGGKIAVSSEVNVGTTVCIQLPIANIEK